MKEAIYVIDKLFFCCGNWNIKSKINETYNKSSYLNLYLATSKDNKNLRQQNNIK